MASVRNTALGSIARPLAAGLLGIALAVSVAPAAAQTVTLEVVEADNPFTAAADGGAPITDFSYLINNDNTGLPFHGDPDMHPGVKPMASHSYVVAAGDEGTATNINIGADGGPLPAAECGPMGIDNVSATTEPCRYLVSVRAPGYKLWGGHFQLPDANGDTITVELLPDHLTDPSTPSGEAETTANLVVKVFPDFAPVNGFPDFSRESCEGPGGPDICPTVPLFDMSNFHIVVEDTVGEVTVDHFGDPICGTGICLTDLHGNLTIPNLSTGKYEVFAIPPTSTLQWIQSSTFEGSRAVGAWLEEGSDGLGAEFDLVREPFVLTQHFFGFVPAMTAPGGPGTITGTARSFSYWPPGEQLTLSQPINRPWITLTDIGATDELIVRVRGNANGTFSITGVPPGTYQMAIWDDPLDYIMAFYTVTVPEGGGTVDMGNLGVFRWFGWLSGFVFNDVNADGIKQSSEGGISNMDLDVRFRDGSVDAVTFTNSQGRYEFPEVLGPLGKFQIAEVGFPRLARTSKSVHNEHFANSPGLFPDSVEGVPGDLGGDLLVNQLILEGIRTIIDWGKKAYVGTDNGGITGIVYYATTRNEFDARLAAAEDYEPGIPNVTMRLWSRGVDNTPNTFDDVLLNELTTDAWEHPSTANGNGCTVLDKDANDLATPGSTPEFVADNCIEVPMNRNETKDGAFDGGYAFEETCTVPGGNILAGPSADGAPGSLPANEDSDQDGVPNHRDADFLFTGDESCTGPIAPGDYVTQVVPPPFYQIVAEEDQNTDEGSDLVPLIPPPPCTGDPHVVVDTRNPFNGQSKPFCNKRLVTLQAKQNPAADFFLFTDMDADPNTKIWSGDARRTDAVPPAGRFFGLVEDNLNRNTDPNSITFGELFSIPGAPIKVRDYTGRELISTNTDENGFYEVLLPSSYTALCPVPGGICPGMYVLSINDPGDGPFVDPKFHASSQNMIYVRDSWPGKMTPTDTPVDPTAVRANCSPDVSIGTAPPVVAATPEIIQASPPYGTAGSAFTIDIKGTDFGPSGTPPTATLTDASGMVTTLSGTYFPGNPGLQLEDTLTATAPASLSAGIYQLLLTNNASGRTGVTGISIHLRGAGYNPPLVLVGPSADPAATPLQDAIDSAAAGSLIVVAPGTYRENVILHKAVMLQGHGPGGIIGSPEAEGGPSTPPGEDPYDHIPGSVIDGRFYTFDISKQTAWAATLAGPASPYDGPATVDPGASITVVADAVGGVSEFEDILPLKPRIDGFGIGFGRGLAGGGIYIHAFGRNLQITNNIIDTNGSGHGGGISIGEPVPEGGLLDNDNDGVGVYHNRILANGGVRYAGGLGIFNGADNYDVAFNDFCANASSEYGGAISHFGLSPGGQIRSNRIFYNDAFDEGGGILVGGDQVDNDTVAGPDDLGYGSGNVVIDANLIQANKSNDDGGGIMLLRPLDYQVDITNNMIINNVAADIGGGLTLDDASNVAIVNNSIALNISTSSAEDRDVSSCDPPSGPAGPASCPHSAGLISTNHSAPFLDYLNIASGFSDPVLFNNIFWENEALFFDPNNPLGDPGEGEGNGLFSAGFIDLEVIGTPAPELLDPQFSLLTVPYGTALSNIVGEDPLFVEEILHGVEAGPLRLAPNEVFVEFPRGRLLDGDYHLQTTPVASPAIDSGTSGPVAGVSPPDHDFDGETRPFGLTEVDIGADETGTGEPPPPTGPIALLYFSTVGNAAIPGVASPYDDADIYQLNDDGTFARVFDATAAPASLPGTADIDALKMVDANTFYVSFLDPVTLPVVGLVDDSDIVLYDSGTWTMFFDGSDVGLDAGLNAEDVDAFEILSGGTSVLVSTVGNPTVPGLTGDNQYDLLKCDASLGSLGPTTSCTWSMYFDGSDVGLGVAPPTTVTGENIDGVSVDGGTISLSTTGDFNVTKNAATLTGQDEDVWLCTGATTGGTSSCAGFSTFFDGTPVPLAADAGDIDAFETAVDPATVATALGRATQRVAGR